jgi:hypothetical protein
MVTEKKLISDVHKWEHRLQEADEKRRAAKSGLADASSALMKYHLEHRRKSEK